MALYRPPSSGTAVRPPSPLSGMGGGGNDINAALQSQRMQLGVKRRMKRPVDTKGGAMLRPRGPVPTIGGVNAGGMPAGSPGGASKVPGPSTGEIGARGGMGGFGPPPPVMDTDPAGVAGSVDSTFVPRYPGETAANRAAGDAWAAAELPVATIDVGNAGGEMAVDKPMPSGPTPPRGVRALPPGVQARPPVPAPPPFPGPSGPIMDPTQSPQWQSPDGLPYGNDMIARPLPAPFVGRGGNSQAVGAGQYGGAPPQDVLNRRLAVQQRMQAALQRAMGGG